MKVFGESDLPSKNTVGKEVQFPIRVDPDSGKEYHGDADFLAWQQSIDSVTKELDETRHERDSGASMAELSMDKLTGIGNLSGVARRFMLLDTEIKTSENMETFEPVIQRCISVVSAGIANISNVKHSKQLANNWITVTFDSIIPKDPVEDAQILSIANGGKPFNSQRTVVSKSPLTAPGDIEEELKRIEEDERRESERNNLVGMPGFGG